MTLSSKQKIGECTLYFGDCLDVLPSIKETADLIISDLPYGNSDCSWDVAIPFEKMWSCLANAQKDNTCIALFGMEPFSSYLRLSNIDNYRYDWYWHKNKVSGAMSVNSRPLRAVETITIFYNKQPKFNPIRTQRTAMEMKRLSKQSVYVTGKKVDNKNWKKTGNRFDNIYKYPVNILNINTVGNRAKIKTNHPAQKPAALMEYFINTYTDKNDVVLDFTMGSGTTGVACSKLGRKFIGIEINKDFFDIACDRIKIAEQYKQVDLFEDEE